MIDVPKGKKYRYWRITSSSKIPAIGELLFLDTERRKLDGKIIKSEKETGKIENAFDGDVLSFVKAEYWYGLDLGSQKEIGQIKYIPRTDANNIFKGHTYQLLYYNNGWIPLESQIAKGDFITFSNIPSNAVYWLRNLTEGVEERIFIYQRNEVVWY